LPETSIPPSSSVTLMVGFTPTSPGSYEQTLTIVSMPTNLTVDLLGTTTAGSGTGPGDDDGGSTASLYACGCRSGRDPSGAIAIGMSMLCVMLPRRRRRL
jgi:hypothetical protein